MKLSMSDLFDWASNVTDLESPEVRHFRVITGVTPKLFASMMKDGQEGVLVQRMSAINAGQEVERLFDLTDFSDWYDKALEVLKAKPAGTVLEASGLSYSIALVDEQLHYVEHLGDADNVIRGLEGSRAFDKGAWSFASADCMKGILENPVFVQLEEGSLVKSALAGHSLMLSTDGHTLKLLGVDNPTDAQLKAVAYLNKTLDAAVDDALDAACLRIQEALNVPTGDYASMHFSDFNLRDSFRQKFAQYLIDEHDNMNQPSGEFDGPSV